MPKNINDFQAGTLAKTNKPYSLPSRRLPLPDPAGFEKQNLPPVLSLPTNTETSALLKSKRYHDLMSCFEKAVDQMHGNSFTKNLQQVSISKIPSVMQTFFKPAEPIVIFNSSSFKEFIHALTKDRMLDDNFKQSLAIRINNVFESIQFTCKLNLVKDIDYLCATLNPSNLVQTPQ